MNTSLEQQQKESLYRVFDEMAFENILFTDDADLAISTAYVYQSILFDNQTNKVIKDYSC